MSHTLQIGVVGRMATRPVVLPETYSGDKDLEQWVYHFENVAAVNEWTNDAKLLWLKVRLTGRAQTAFQRFPDEAKATYAAALRAAEQTRPVSGRVSNPQTEKDRRLG